MWKVVAEVSEVWVYPLKSARGVSLAQAQVTARGLWGDRRWMLVDARGQMISQRTCPKMATLAASVWGERGLRVVSVRGGGEAEVEPPQEGERVEVEVWGDRVEARTAPEAVSAWLAGELGVRCALVYLPEEVKRPVDARFGLPEDEVSFADGFPLLVLSQGSATDLGAQAQDAGCGDVRRLRPNVVVEGCAPYAEDGWSRIRIGGEVELALVKPCGRCGLINVDPDTGRVGDQPLRALTRYRRTEDGKVNIGQNAIPRRLGTVRVGDAVEAWIGGH